MADMKRVADQHHRSYMQPGEEAEERLRRRERENERDRDRESAKKRKGLRRGERTEETGRRTLGRCYGVATISRMLKNTGLFAEYRSLL